jgi:murein DD-endopeptidase MepM/ murein hydrolase activator NlpD
MRYGAMSEMMRAVSRLAIVAVVGGMAAACSSDTMRFAENPFSDPFGPAKESEPRATGSIDAAAPAAITPMPRSTVSSAPLGAPTASSSPSRVAAAPYVPSSPSSSLAGLNPSYKAGAPTAPQAPAHQASAPARTVAAAPIHAPAPVAQAAPARGEVVARYRLVEGKKPVAETARKEPVRTAAAPAHIRPGQTARPVHEARAEEPVRAAHPRPGRVAAVREPTKAEPKPVARVAKAEPAPAPAKKVVAAAEPVKVAKPAPAEPAPAQVAQVKPAKTTEAVKVASVAPAKTVQPEPAKAAPAPVVAAAPAPPAAPAAKEPEATGALTAAADFRWPARGRVITGFGGSGSNEGINIAVPDGTPVKAAEAGTVAYAGSEVKGYGNLVLIRHDNGYVSAYAHNGEIDVKRGQKVTRGQVIAKSGQTGNVTSPQLHFELRKGSTPVDPMPHLASN